VQQSEQYKASLRCVHQLSLILELCEGDTTRRRGPTGDEVGGATTPLRQAGRVRWTVQTVEVLLCGAWVDWHGRSGCRRSSSASPSFPPARDRSRLAPLDPQELVLKHQQPLTKSLVALVTPPSASVTSPVKPGRPARALIARILVTLLRRGDTKHLFDLAQSLLRCLNGSDTKGAPDREKEWRIAAAYVLGEVYAGFGQQVMSLYIEIVMATTRVFRTSSHPVILRHAALVCLRKVISVVARSMSDQTTRDTLKALRAGLGDKAGAIVRGCAEVRPLCSACLRARPSRN